ncbi:hypothetical protein K440DRAFT_641943 [Wilcoxina mikolae CBS 423.85]|nr:hypothetical protein K440DRAFT_641943 [Wilcoxina mikolae CBS 423.85]
MRFPLYFPLVFLFASIAASQLVGADYITSALGLNKAQASKISSVIAKETTASYYHNSGYDALLVEVSNFEENFTKTNTWYSIAATMTATNGPAATKAAQSVMRQIMKDYYDAVEKVVETQTYLTGSAKESLVSDFKEGKKVVDEAIKQADDGNGAERVVNSGLTAVVVAVAAAVMVL